MEIQIVEPSVEVAGTQAVQPIRLGIVGANFGAGIARNLAVGNPFIELAGICDLDTTKAHSLASELGVAAFDDLDTLLADESVEAIGLFTGPTGRAKLIGKILREGRHVMTTKPFDLEVAASAAVLDEARERGLAVHLNSPAPVASEDIAQIRSWVSGYDLGRPIAMRAETWCNYREQANGTWYDDNERCPAAPIFRLGVYFLNDFAALLGKPRRVHLMCSRIFTGRPTPDNAQLSIEYHNGALAHVFASFCVNDGEPYRDQVTLNYERGTIHRWVEREPSLDMANDRAVIELHTPGSKVVRAETQPGAFAGWYDWRAFHHAIRGSGNVPLQNRDAVIFGVRLLDAMKRSSLTGLPEDVR